MRITVKYLDGASSNYLRIVVIIVVKNAVENETNTIQISINPSKDLNG